jgi:hypothetical protein
MKADHQLQGHGVSAPGIWVALKRTKVSGTSSLTTNLILDDIIRRHTTVPKFNQQPGCSTNEQQELVAQQVDERLRKFSVCFNFTANKLYFVVEHKQ